jgi:hypothetical protein
MAGVSRLRPRVPALFEPYRPSEGLLAAGSAATGNAWGAALRPNPPPLESEAAAGAARGAPNALSGTGGPARRDAAHSTPSRAHAPLEVLDGLLRPPTTVRLAPQQRAAAAPARQPGAPAPDIDAASSAVAAPAEAAARTGRPAPPTPRQSGLRDAPPQASADSGRAATPQRSEFEPRTVATARRPPERPRPDDDRSGHPREIAVSAVSQDSGSRVLAPSAQGAAAAVEMSAATVNVVIGKITVQANMPSAPAPAPPRAVAPAGPRLSLEQYLMQRGGRG